MTNITKGTKVRLKMNALPPVASLALMLTDFFEEELVVHDVIDENFQYAHPETSNGDVSELIAELKSEGMLGKAYSVLIPETSDFEVVGTEEGLVDGAWEILVLEEDLEVIQ